MKLLEAWDRLLARPGGERFYLVLLAVLAAVVTAVVGCLALSLHRNFLTIACDTAAFQNAIANIQQGNWFRETAYDGPNLLGLHLIFVLVLVAPIYSLFPSADTLFLLQIAGVYGAIIPLYLVAWDILRRPLVAFLIAVAALVSPFLLHMAMAPFHPETWMLAAVLWSCYFYRRNRMTGFWISMLFALSCGEQAALIYVALGLALLWGDDGIAWRKRYGRFALVAGLGWAIVAVAVIFPLMRSDGQRNLFAYNYADWNANSAADLTTAVPQSPLHAAAMLLNPSRWWHVAAIVGLPLLLAFFSRRSVLLLAPFPFYLLMKDHEFFLYFHAYYFQFAFLAGYLGLIYFLARFQAVGRVTLAVLILTLMVNILTIGFSANFYAGFATATKADEPLNRALHAVFATIPRDAAVYGPHRYSAYLSSHPDMVMGDLADENLDFKAMLDARFNVTGVHPERIDYIVCDLDNDQCGWRHRNLSAEKGQRRAANLNRLVHTGQWQVFWNQDDVVILRRTGK